MAAPQPAPPIMIAAANAASAASAAVQKASQKTYARLRLITGGTFTPSIALDWSLQFDSGSTATMYLPTVGGEFQVPAVSAGVCLDFAFQSYNPFDFQYWVEATGAAHTQICMNGVITEISASGLQTLSAVQGFNTLKITRNAPVLVGVGQAFGQSGITQWVSSFPAGSDPVNNPVGSGGGPGGIGTNSPTNGGNPSIG